ncbi:MAG TPA: hypothetical protein DD725_06030 [Deltaproteobacteria bacterium]|nr:hypothetical protein [Deltaproteobacteria bacterium]
MKQKEFITADIWLASAISILLNTPPEFQVVNHKTLFIFPGDNETYRAISEYNGGCSLPAYLFAATIKKLKVEMLTRRDGGRQ